MSGATNGKSGSQAKSTTPPPAFSLSQAGILQRKCDCGSVAGLTGQCEDCSSKRLSGQGRVSNPPSAGDEVSQMNALTATQQLPGHSFGRMSVQAKVLQRINTPNKTGLPDAIKAGVESLSGYSLDDVRVHYNSPKPAQLQALAYTQGTEIHVAPGQEKHLPHEAWHVIQQKQGRVKPTMQMRGVGINDDVELERESDLMGKKVNAVPYSKADDARPNSIPFARDEKNQTKMTYVITKETRSQRAWTTGLNETSANSQPIQCQFSERIDRYMVVVRDSALRHLTEQQMRLVIAQPAFLIGLNGQYNGNQVDNLTIHVSTVNIQVNIYPAGKYPPVVEVYHADAGYQAENKQKAIDRWNSLYGK